MNSLKKLSAAMNKKINLALAVLNIVTALIVFVASIWQFKNETNRFFDNIMLLFSTVPALWGCFIISNKGKLRIFCLVLIFIGFITGMIGLITILSDRPFMDIWGLEPVTYVLPLILYIGVMLVDICGKKAEKKDILYIISRLLHYDILIYMNCWLLDCNISQFTLFCIIAMSLAGNEISSFAYQQKNKMLKNVLYVISLAFAIPSLVICFRGYWGEISRDGMFAIMLIFMIIMFVFNVINTYNNYKKLSVKNLER